MTARLMRRISSTSRVRAQLSIPKNSAPLTAVFQQPRRSLANIQDRDYTFPELWFNSSRPCPLPAETGLPDHKPPDERTLKLGKTIRMLHERLPNLLASPLPQEILSPQITLHLFPSTHPHLPTVSGRIAYTAALWTAPVAWGRVPVVGNVKLIITSERMVRNGGTTAAPEYRSEKLIVRWKTCEKSKGKTNKITEFLGGDVSENEEFCGLFIFEFDEEGRIVSHTIERAEEGGNYDRMRVISVTDWLLGKAWGKKGDEAGGGLALGYCETGQHHRSSPSRNGRRPQ